MPQEFMQAQSAQENNAGEQVVAATVSQDMPDMLDAVLGDIESVLASNAEEYVDSFVQKGGE